MYEEKIGVGVSLYKGGDRRNYVAERCKINMVLVVMRADRRAVGGV